MNILVLNYEFPPIGGGASPVSYEIGKGLADLGHQITVVTMAYRDLPLYEEKDGMKIYRIKCLRKEKRVCHPWEQATYILSAVSFIRRKLDVRTYDICHVHFIIPTGPVAWWLKRKYRLPYVITSHGSDVLGHNNKRFKILYKMLKSPWSAIVRSAEAVVAPSCYLEELMRRSEPNGNYVGIVNGIDTVFFTGGERKKKQILIMCRLQETKNVQCVLRALHRLELHDWKVLILGDGPYREKLKELVREYHLQEQVEFRGWVENRSKEHLCILQESAIYISASKVENCPTSVLEAAACGDHLLLSDIPAHRQLAEPLDSKIFFPADRDDVLAEQLGSLMETINGNGDMKNHYDMEPYDWKISIKKYEDLLQKTATVRSNDK
jgi:glycosyltransferase involved in cell wall biosynthesis